MEDWPMIRWIFLLMIDLGEDITRNSVFESLIFSLFLIIRDRMSDMHYSIFKRDNAESRILNEK